MLKLGVETIKLKEKMKNRNMPKVKMSMKTKSFQEHLEKRLTKKEIAEIEAQADLEFRALLNSSSKNSKESF